MQNSDWRMDTGPSRDHAVQFYHSDDFLDDAVAGHLAEGIATGQPLVLVATARRMDAVQWRLANRGFDVDRAHRSGDLILLDARETLAGLMLGSMPDEALFNATVGRVIGRSARSRGDAPVRAFGEMVDLLWQDGNPRAALRLEELWNDLARRHALSLLCAYAMGNFAHESDAEPFIGVCGHHGRVLPAESYDPGADEGTRERQISVLQQRALALEGEIRQRKKVERALRSALAERRRAEVAHRELKEKAEKASEAKSQFLTVMSHELRTPLNAIIGYQDLLAQEVAGPITASQRRYVTRIRSASEQLLRLIDQVLSLSRIEAGTQELDLERLELSSLTSETVSMIEPAAIGKGLSISVRAPTDPVVCVTDPGKFRQILLNLLSNAVKFTDAGSVDVDLALETDVVAVHVRDSGPGVSESDHVRIFEPFVQTSAAPSRHPGTGLGLPVSRKLARMLGGDVTLESVEGAGSTFTLRIPAAAD